MATFLHGVETIEIERGPRPIQQVKSAVIGLVGTAPIHLIEDESARPPVNRPVLVLNERDAAQFGPDTKGYTIPSALQAIFDQGAGAVIVVNVWPGPHDDEGQHPLPTVRVTIIDGELQIPPIDVPDDFELINHIALTKNEDGSGAFARGTDFDWVWDDGAHPKPLSITILPGSPLASETVVWLWGYYKKKAITVEDLLAADIIGTTTPAGRTGAQAWLDAASLYGFGPKVLIAPGFSSEKEVASAMQVLAQDTKLRAIALVDAPVGATRAQVLEGRGTSGDLDLDIADERLLYCYPHVKVGDQLEPYSPRLAGAIAATDANLGYWHSPSNKPLLGVTGIETPLTASINDPSCDVNALNAAGVVTIFTGYGAGIRTWGNRSSAFPGDPGIKAFIPVRRTIDMVDEAIEQATLRYLDGPITEVLITAILDDVNAFLRVLTTRGALMPGSRLEYFAEDNPPVELAAGHITFTKTFCPPPPAERITYKSVVDTTLLRI